jgi:hypothetical protein
MSSSAPHVVTNPLDLDADFGELPPNLAPPAPPPAPAPPPKPVLPEMPDAVIRFPLSWILSNATGAGQYRAIMDVARLVGAGTDPFAGIALSHASALRCAVTMRADGTWGGRLFAQAGAAPHLATFSAVRHLLECGWDRDSPPLAIARRFLFRLLANDEDPSLLFELAAEAGTSKERARRLRITVREEAAALLAQAGYERDPRVRQVALRSMQRVTDYLRSPLAAKPWIRVGNKQVLPSEAAPPSLGFLRMLAFMPQVRAEFHVGTELLYKHCAQDQPRQESVQQVDGALVSMPQLVLGDWLPHRNAVEADIPAALQWLELMVRLGFFRRNEIWIKLFERFVDMTDRRGVWQPAKPDQVPTATTAEMAGWFPLATAMEGEERWTDVTLRIGLIARLIGRELEIT